MKLSLQCGTCTRKPHCPQATRQGRRMVIRSSKLSKTTRPLRYHRPSWASYFTRKTGSSVLSYFHCFFLVFLRLFPSSLLLAIVYTPLRRLAHANVNLSRACAVTEG